MRKRLCLIFFTFVFKSLLSLEADVKQNIGTGIGYEKNYTTISVYHTFEQSSWSPFVDGRLLFFHKGRPGFNIGGGTQYLFSNQNAIGGYGYVDFRKGPDRYSFWQLTPGVSYTHHFAPPEDDLGDLQVFANGYFPVRWRNKNIDSPTFNCFEGNHLLINRIDRIALTGFNIEVGYRTPAFYNWRAYVAVSPYFFKRSKENTRLQSLEKVSLSYKELLSFEGAISHDRIFGTRINAIFKISIPLTPKYMNQAKKGRYRKQTSYPPKKFEQIVLTKTEETVTARDSNGDALNFIFVNNLSNSLGTFESPFSTLKQAENASNPGDFIYVSPGDGTTKGMDQGITLRQGQTLSGSGTPLPISTNIGNMTILPLTSTSPRITNSSGDVITINSNNYISGLQIVTGNSTGIYGLEGISGTTITNNYISGNNFSYGILIHGNGDLNISNNQIGDQNGVLNYGIRVISDPGLSMNAILLNNRVFNHTDQGLTISGNGTFVVNHNTTQSSGFQGIRFETTSSNQTLTGEVIGNVTSGEYFGVGTNSDYGSSINIQIGNNTFSGHSVASIFLGSSGGEHGDIIANIYRNTIDTGATGVVISSTTPALSFVSITDNKLSNLTLGISRSASAGNLNPDVKIKINGNQFQNISSSDVSIENNSSEDLSLILKNNQVSQGQALKLINSGNSFMLDMDGNIAPLTTSGTITLFPLNY